MLYASILLHGICYDFFFVTGYMYTEQKAGEKSKIKQHRGLFTFATYGVGMVIGTRISGITVDHFKSGETHHWQNIWMVPAFIAIGVLAYFLIFFKEKQIHNNSAGFALNSFEQPY